MKRIVEPLRSANQEFFLQRNNPTIEDCQLSKIIKSKIEIKQKVIPLLKGLSHLEISEIKIFNSNRKKNYPRIERVVELLVFAKSGKIIINRN